MASFDFGELLDSVAHHIAQNRHFFAMYLHLIVSALFPIIAGSHASLSRPSSAAKPAKDDPNADDDDEEEETVQKMEGLTPKDAIIFPLTAGCVLGGLYWLITTYGAGIINTVLGVYFSVIGTYSVGTLINDTWTTLAGFVTPNYYWSQGKLWKVVDAERKVVVVHGGSSKDQLSRASPLWNPLGAVPLPSPLLDCAWAIRSFTRQKFLVKGYTKDLFDFRLVLTRHNVASAVLGVAAISYSLFVDKPWQLTNLQGFAVSYGALQLMSPTTFTTGTLILAGLFFYDIWAVFFTPLMVTVAKNLDVPIKLVFPRPDDPNLPPTEATKRNFSMLGLGDIVLPGLMIALALRFDLHMFYLRKQKTVMAETKTKSGEATTTETIEKAPYVSVTGHWAEKLYTSTSGGRPSALPACLSSSFPKPYYHASLIGYVAGMLLTLGFMSVFQHAQPALLYLVPCVLISIWGCGLTRGEWKEMYAFTEAINAEPVEDDESMEDKEEHKAEEASSLLDIIKKEFKRGLNSTKEEKPVDVKKEKEKEKEKEKGKGKEKEKEKEKVARPADVDKDSILSFTITRHSPSSKKASEPVPEEAAVKTGSKSSAVKPGRSPQSPFASSDDDAVLVGSADLDGSAH